MGLPTGAAAMPDISALFMLRHQAHAPRAASPTTAEQGRKHNGHGGTGKRDRRPSVVGVRVSSSVGGMADDGTTMDCGLAAAAFNRVVMQKWLWASELLVNVSAWPSNACLLGAI